MTLGTGMPAVCVPVMGRTMAQLAQAVSRAREAQADVIELRIDAMAEMPQAETAEAACRIAREGGVPVLFTLRTRRDGGAGGTDAAAYEALLREMIERRACDAIDCELSVGEAAFARIARHARDGEMTLVGSSHEFGEIGDVQRAADWLMRQQELGAQVCKAAVMAHSPAEALALAHAYAQAHERLAIPMIGIAMGPHGLITRVCGACFGSCLTFAAAGEASAPGQMDARRLRTALQIIQEAQQKTEG